jgi:Ca2+-binding EF-hand superfamily protein
LGEGRKGSFIYSVIDGLRSKNKPINFDEFVELVSPRVGDLKTKEGLKTVFKLADKDEDDFINYDELKQLARIAGDYINDEEILEMLHSLHVNHKTNTNEGIYFEEFYLIVTKYYKTHSH